MEYFRQKVKKILKETEILNEKLCRSNKTLIEKFPNPDVISALIEAGSCVDTRTNYGERPLTLAARAESIKAVKVLLVHGKLIFFLDF